MRSIASATLFLLPLAGCGLLPPASSRVMQACLPAMGGPYASFAACVQGQNPTAAIQDDSATRLKTYVAAMTRAVATGTPEDRAYAATVQAADAISASRHRQASAQVLGAAALVGANARMMEATQPATVYVRPLP